VWCDSRGISWCGFRDPLSDAVHYANHADLDRMTYTALCRGGQGYVNDNAVLQAGSARDFLRVWDNNNGYVFVHIGDDLSVSFDILTGREDDAAAPQSIGPREYALQFCSEQELAEVEGFCEALAVIDGFARIDALSALTVIRERLCARRRRPRAA
jgi:hypothetical protein